MKNIYAFITGLILLFSTTAFAQPGVTTPSVGVSDFTISGTSSYIINGPCSGASTNVDGWLVSANSTSNCAVQKTSSTGGNGRLQFIIGFGTLVQLQLGSNDGATFSLTEFAWGVSSSSLASKPMTIVGYKLGSPVSGATLNATTPAATGVTNTVVISFTNNTAFSNIDEFRIAPTTGTCNSNMFFDYITIAAPAVVCITPTLSTVGQTSVSCNGGSNGTATVSASGGGPFTYTCFPAAATHL